MVQVALLLFRYSGVREDRGGMLILPKLKKGVRGGSGSLRRVKKLVASVGLSLSCGC
jgi:hypothetical protein